MNKKYGDLEVGLQSYNNNYGTEVPSPSEIRLKTNF